MKRTKKQYEEWLNSISPSGDSDEWIIGGKWRVIYSWQNKYGTAIRRHDPIAFEVGYNEFKWKIQKR